MATARQDSRSAADARFIHLLYQNALYASLRATRKATPEREHFLELAINAQLAAGEVVFGRYEKPVPFFQPMVDTLSKAILLLAAENYQAIVYVDGIDRKKARELTVALREKGIKTQQVRSARDESELLIRLADRWAGCIRGRFEGNEQVSTDTVRHSFRDSAPTRGWPARSGAAACQRD